MTFSQKIQAACQAKEELIDQHMVRYAVKSIFAGAFLTLSTGVGGIAADVINRIHPSLGRFVFPFIFSFGLVYILFLNSELVTSNMMYLTAGAYYRYISVKKVLKILVVCTLFNLVGAALIAALFNQSFAYTLVNSKSFLVALSKPSWPKPPAKFSLIRSSQISLSTSPFFPTSWSRTRQPRSFWSSRPSSCSSS